MFGIPPEILSDAINLFNSYFISDPVALNEISKSLYSLIALTGGEVSKAIPSIILGNVLSWIGEILYTKNPTKFKSLSKIFGSKEEISFDKIEKTISNTTTFQKLINAVYTGMENPNLIDIMEKFSVEAKDLNLSKGELMELFLIVKDLITNQRIIDNINDLTERVSNNLQISKADIIKVEANLKDIILKVVDKIEQTIKETLLDLQRQIKRNNIIDTKFDILEENDTKIIGNRQCWIDGKIELGEINFNYDARRQITDTISKSIEKYFGTIILSKPYFGKTTILKRIIIEKYTLEKYFVIFTNEISENSIKIKNTIEDLILEYPKVLVVIDDAHRKGIENILKIYEELSAKLHSNLYSSKLKFLFAARYEEFKSLKLHLNQTERKFYDYFINSSQTNQIEIEYTENDAILYFIKGFEVTFPSLEKNILEEKIKKVSNLYIKQSKENDRINPLIFTCNLRNLLTSIKKAESQDRFIYNAIKDSENNLFSKCLENDFIEKRIELDKFSLEEKRAALICTFMNCFNIPFSIESLKKCNIFLDVIEKLHKSHFIEKTYNKYGWIHDALSQHFLIYLYKEFAFDFDSFNNRYSIKDVISCIFDITSYDYLLNIIARCYVMYKDETTRYLAAILIENFKVPIFLNNKEKVDIYSLGLGSFYYEIQNFQKALDQFNKAITIDPKNMSAHINKSLALFQLNNIKDAFLESDYVIRNSHTPEDITDSFTNQGNFLYKLQRYQEAIDEFDKAIAINPNHLNSRNNKGKTLIELMKYQEAIDEFDKAIAINPNFDGPYNDRGACLLRTNRYQEAIDEFDKAIAINPNNSDAYYNKGMTLIRLGRYQEAIDEFDKAKIKLSNVTKENAISYDNNNDDQLEKLKDNKISKMYDIFYGKGKALFNLKLYQEAIDEFDRINLINFSDDIHYFRGKTLYSLNRYQEAIDEFDKDITINATSETHFFKGLSLFEIKKYQEAIDEFDKAIAIDPKVNSLDDYHRSICLFNLERYQEAIYEFDKLIDKYPENSYFYLNKGKALFNLKLYQEAIDEFDKAIAINPNKQEYKELKNQAILRLNDKI